jgi:hypothetical protein
MRTPPVTWSNGVLTAWPAGYRYVWNRPALSLAENMNHAVEISIGQWDLQLDEDYLLPGAGEAMLDPIRRAARGPRCATTVRAAGGPRPGRVAEVAARAGRVHGRTVGRTPIEKGEAGS